MHQTTVSLSRKIKSAGDLQTVVGTLKAIAASAIGPYEKAAASLVEYDQIVSLGLAACLENRSEIPAESLSRPEGAKSGLVAILFGSDQGLVGNFNESVSDFATRTIGRFEPTGNDVERWVVGEQIAAFLGESGMALGARWNLPANVAAIVSLCNRLLIKMENRKENGRFRRMLVFHNRMGSRGEVTPVVRQLWPFDAGWRNSIASLQWPTRSHPEIVGGVESAWGALTREYLFLSLFRACAESQAAENSRRLASMERAERNIVEILDEFKRKVNQLRQMAIDEELFDVVSGFEFLPRRNPSKP